MTGHRRPAPPDRNIPDGYILVAAEDPAWVYGSLGYTKCRRRGCDREPVARLMRYSRRWNRNLPWAYCADHMYSRWVEDGKVMYWRIAKDAE